MSELPFKVKHSLEFNELIELINEFSFQNTLATLTQEKYILFRNFLNFLMMPTNSS